MIQKLPLTCRFLENAYMEWGKTIFVVVLALIFISVIKYMSKIEFKNLVKSHSNFYRGKF